jgi:putative SOS response-associated peptidase YedK
MRFALADRGLMAPAGVWETWRSPAGERVRSFAIITTAPNELCAEIHNRTPVEARGVAGLAWRGTPDAPHQTSLDVLVLTPEMPDILKG